MASTIGIAETHKRKWAFPERVSETSVGKLCALRGSPELNSATFIEVTEQNETAFDIRLPARQRGKVVSLKGYYQNLHSFDRSFRTLRKHLQISPDLQLSVLKQVPEVSHQDSVTVHVRRGDYTSMTDLYVLLNNQYYKQAIAQIPNVSVIIIVSDDITWCKENLDLHPTARIVFSPYKDELYDFVLLYSGQHIVIANSSFSWWAAYLNRLHRNTSGSVVIAPEKWFREDGGLAHLHRRTIYPSTWKLVNITEDDKVLTSNIARRSQ